MKVTFLYHSAVMVQLKKHVLIFDACKPPLPNLSSQIPVYLFYSHAHDDHYHPDILEYLQSHMKLIVSDDIALPSHLKTKSLSVHAHQLYQFDDLTIETLASNDQGVAFIVQCEGMTIYHSGDLNDWHWQDETGALLKAQYLQELQHINGRYFDLACIPLDPRLGSFQADGILYFLQYANPKAVLPIHCWEKFTCIKKMIKQYPQLPIISISKNNTDFEMESLD